MRGARSAAAAVLAVALGLGSCGQRDEQPLVFAAASLREVCAELAAEFERAGGEPVQFHFAGSNLLARQIVAARRADAFLSADEHQVDLVEAAGLVSPGTRRALLTNELVVVVPIDSELRIEAATDLRAVDRLSLANPELVPAGRYARAWLEDQGLWSEVSERVFPALDVRAALAAVEVGAADAGVCYATDAATSQRVRIAYRVPVERAPRIVYVACALESSASGRAFVEFLAGPAARAIFERHGFGVLGLPGEDG